MTFPSHQGFVAPLWRRWPNRFDLAALCVGAAMPDVVDGLIGLARGHFGQGIGHSLLGLAVLGVPLGLLLREAVCWTARRLPPTKPGGLLACAWNLGVAALGREPAATIRSRSHRGLLVTSVAVGAFSHLLFDLISHGHFPWLLPWVPKLAIFPEWWYDTWIRVWLPWHPAGRKIGPHATIWLALSLWGAWLLLRPAFQAWRRPCHRNNTS